MPSLILDSDILESGYSMILDSKPKFTHEPILKQKFEEQIHRVCFSPYDWSQDLLCVVLENKIQVLEIKIQDEIEFDVIGEFNHTVHCSHITMSPVTSLAVLPKILQFSAAGSDGKIRIYKSDLVGDNSSIMLSGHLDFINDLSYDCESNNLASCSDDQTARIWDTNTGTCITTFYLQSPGMTVCWHIEDCAKLMVCEKSGIIRFYNVHSQQPILSLDNGAMLSYAHWNPSDSQVVGALSQGELKLWDLTRPSRPASSRVINVENGGYMKFNQDGNLVAVVSPLSFSLKLLQHENNQIKLNAQVTLPTNVTWHFRLPLICIGDDRNLCFWRVEMN